METREGKQVDTNMVFVINYIIASSSKHCHLVICYIVIITILPQQVDWRGGEHLCMPRRGKEGKTDNRWNDFPSRSPTPPTRWTEFPTSWNGYGSLHTSQLHGYKPLGASGAFL